MFVYMNTLLRVSLSTVILRVAVVIRRYISLIENWIQVPPSSVQSYLACPSDGDIILYRINSLEHEICSDHTFWNVNSGTVQSVYIDFTATVLPTKSDSDSDVAFCLQSYMELIIDRSLVY